MESTNKKLPNYSIWNIEKYSPESFNAIADDEEKLLYLVSIGHLAPSTHNTQPWKFKIKPQEYSISIYLDPLLVLPISDIKARQAIISVGCAIANIEIAAKYLTGIENIEFNNIKDLTLPTDQHLLIATIYISRNWNPFFEFKLLFNAIFERRTIRGEMNAEAKIDESILANILKACTEEVTTIFINDWDRKSALAELQGMADSFVINNKKFCDELIQGWIIENDSLCGLGMPGDTFYLNDQQTKAIKDKSKKGHDYEAYEITEIINLGKRGILNSNVVGMILVDEDNPNNWVKGGILLEKIWLEFESNNIAMAIHAGLAEVNNVNTFILKPLLSSTKRPLILFRAGYLKSNEKKPFHSPRQEVKNILIK